ncbi:MAG: hypothetical protein ACFE9L_13795 [Candidatus Hodarchaeota archaeon]
MQRKRKQRRKDSETWKRFMSTILSQLPLPTYIQKYSPEEQELITEFLNILQHFEVNTSQKRETLEGLLNSYNNKYYPNHEKYLNLPFLWFTIDYFNIARRILNAAGFYPARFYKYLVQYFRGDSQIQGIFDLIRTTTPLNDLRWEKLQYSCNRFTIPLTDDELQALEAVYSYLSSAGLRALNQRRLKAIIANRVRNPKFIRRLAQLFTLLNAEWNIRFYPPAFGLEQLFFQFQLNESTSLAEILDLQNPANTILGASYVYQIDEFHNYIGIMWLSTQTIKAMQDYLIQKEKQGFLILNGLARVLDTQVSSSLKLYEPRKGWRSLNASEYRRLKHQLRPSISRRRSFEPSPFHFSPPFDTRWDFQKDSNNGTPSQYISLCSKFSKPFHFDNLLQSGQLGKDNVRFSDNEIRLLNELYNKQVIQVNFDPIRLFLDYSTDQYCIPVPATIPFERLGFLLSYLPKANIFTTEDQTNYIWSFLTPEIKQFLVQDIELNVYKLSALHWGRNIETVWFDTQSSEWKIPHVIKPLI